MSWPPRTGVVLRPSQSERLVYLKNGFTYYHQIFQGHPHPSDIQMHWMWRHELLPIGSYREKNRRKWHIRWLRVECLKNNFGEDHQILQWRPCRPTFYNHSGYDVVSYFRMAANRINVFSLGHIWVLKSLIQGLHFLNRNLLDIFAP